MIDFPNYAVTKDGQIWSYKTHKFLSLGREEKNSLHVTLFQNGVRHLRKVHRLVAEGYLPNPESKENVYHINGMRDDNRVENLAWGTPSESSKNAWNTGACSVEKNCIMSIVAAAQIATFKPVVCLETGKVYPSAADASRRLRLESSSDKNVIARNGKALNLSFAYIQGGNDVLRKILQ